jgi:hypothetical protein
MLLRKTFFLLLLLLFCTENVSVASLIVKDGTFLLRQRQKELDYEQKKQFLLNPSVRACLNLPRGNLQINHTEVGFQVYNFVSGRYEYKPGIMVAEGEHCRIFLEKGRLHAWGEEREKILKQIVTTFDQHVYQTVTQWFGEPYIPPEFYLPDAKIFIFLVDIQDGFSDGYVAGYFDHRDIDGLFGNQKPVFFMDISPGKPGDPSDKANPFFRTLAHEFQHMVSFSRRLKLGLPAQERWLDEGFSMFSEFIFSGRVGENDICFPPSPHYEKFVEDPLVNLFSSSSNSWFKEDRLFRQYGASFLFTTYMIEKVGGKTIAERQGFCRSLIDKASPGAAGLDKFLNSYSTGLTEVFQNWTLACYLNDAEMNGGLWHFASLPVFRQAKVGQLPLRHVTHFYAREASSFLGGEGATVPNTINLEEIRGEAPVRIRFNFADGMTPALVIVGKDGEVSLVNLSATADREKLVDLDLEKLERAFLLPVAVKTDFLGDEKINFSFASVSNGLLMYPVANPAFPDQFIIFLRSAQQPLLATPTLKISLNNLIDSPQFVPVDERRAVFAAHYRLPGNGRGQATCYAGEDSCSFSFSAARVSGDGVSIRPDAKTFLVYNSDASAIDAAAMVFEDATDLNLEQKGLLAGPFNIVNTINASATMIFERIEDLTGVGLARIGSWHECIEWQPVKMQASQVSANVRGSGKYALMCDKTPPVIESFGVIGYEKPSAIEIKLGDDFSGIAPDTLKVSIDGYGPIFPVTTRAESFIFALPQLACGEKVFRISFADRAGNVVETTRLQALAGMISLQSWTVFPNPCQGRCRMQQRFSAAINLISARTRIYDCAGDLVVELEPVQVAADLIETAWDSRNSAGHKVSNGVYLAKTRIVTDQGSFKAGAKIAVLR